MPETAKSSAPNGDRDLAPAKEVHPNCGGASQDAACSPEALCLGRLF